MTSLTMTMSSTTSNSLAYAPKGRTYMLPVLTGSQVVPEKYSKYKLDPIDEFFAMGRGRQVPQTPDAAAVDVPALVGNQCILKLC